MENPYQETFDRLAARLSAIASATADERVDKIRRLYQATWDLRGEISAACEDELGMNGLLHLVPLKPEVDFVCQHVEQWMQKEPVGDAFMLDGRKAHVHYEPKGMVLHIGSWNSPILISLHPVIAMIAAGNAVVIKPSEIAPRSAEIVAEIINRAGLSDDIAVIQGDAETAQNLLKLPFNHICYIGSSRVGQIVMKAAADHFADITLELGGKNPVVVAADADLSDAGKKLAFGRCLVSGQSCLGPDYCMVDHSVKDQFVEELKKAFETFFNPQGQGVDKSKDYARIINRRHTERIKKLRDDAAVKGAKIVYGGEIDVENRFVAPTIIEDVTDEMDIAFEEIFGPIITISSFSSKEDVVREIAKRPKPLGAYIFTTSRETADWFIGHTRAGTTAVNNVVTQANINTLPYGGVNASGIGRLGGHAGFKEFSNGRAIVEDPIIPSERPPQTFPPMPDDLIANVEALLRP